MSEAPNVKRKRTKAASESSPWEWVEGTYIRSQRHEQATQSHLYVLLQSDVALT